MSRQGRTVLVIGIVALLGVVSLAVLAKRYGRLIPAAQPVQKPPAPAAPSAPEGAPDAAEVDREVDAFLQARQVIRANLEKEYGPIEPRKTREPVRHARAEQDQALFRALVGIRLERDAKLQAAGVSMKRYREIRDAYRKWIDGKPVPDATLGAAFDRRPDELLAADLAGFDPFDY
jgi:hypothetical protein